MKKLFLSLFIGLLAIGKSSACADYDPDYDYYNLFIQDIINDPQYYPFLYTSGLGYYSVSDTTDVAKNENIKEWQEYLGISYDNAYYLVFKATRGDIRNLATGKSVADKKLDFANSAFVTKHKQALLYIAYAKYLEPYMTISGDRTSEWRYYPDDYQTADQLEYEKVITVLERSWKAETDKELRLRYGYQLVRFAHYNRNYTQAIKYFKQFVETLNYKPAMYYYALDQYAGAQRGAGLVDEANYNFFKVFTHSGDLKAGALSSINFTENVNFENFLTKAKSENEINDAYLLLGYLNFSNPLSAIQKIVSTTPDAIQAKVLMARAINSIERTYVRSSYYCWEGDCFKDATDKRYPIVRDKDLADTEGFFRQMIDLSSTLANQASVKDKDFWNLTSAYLHFLNRDYSLAKTYLDKVRATDKKYKQQKTNLTMYIDIAEQPKITPEVEVSFYSKYKDILSKDYEYHYGSDASNNNYNTRAFVVDLLANRYFIQGDYAKSFLMNNNILALQNNPDMELLSYLETFYNKTNKNSFEKLIETRFYPKTKSVRQTSKDLDIPSVINYMRGDVYLAQGNVEHALASYKKIKPGFTLYRETWEGVATFNQNGYSGFNGISNKVFGYNQIECFECGDYYIGLDYLSDFPYIKKKMNKVELAEALIQLQNEGKKTDEKAAKANYLLGNFFYNITSTGYYRNLTRFDQDNAICEKYRINNKPHIFDDIYFKNYSYNTYFENRVITPQQYLERAYYLQGDDELKARIVFALSKCEQALFYEKIGKDSSYFYSENKNEDGILIKDRKYFKELQKYKQTAFYDEVLSNCLYFSYYVKHY